MVEQGTSSYDRDQRYCRIGAHGRAFGNRTRDSKKSIEILDLSPEQKRGMVNMLNEQENYPISAACELLELPPSTYYYRPVQADENELEAAIEEIAGQSPI